MPEVMTALGQIMQRRAEMDTQIGRFRSVKLIWRDILPSAMVAYEHDNSG